MCTSEETKILVRPQTCRLFDTGHALQLTCGESLAPVDVTFETYGRLSPCRDNVILVIHALTGSAHAAFWNTPQDRVPGWWHGLIGPGKGLDTDRYFIVCANLLGSCYGTTGPTSLNPATGQPYGLAFPQVTTADMARVQKALLDYLEIPRVRAVLGGSLGGMIVWQMAVQYPDLMDIAIPIAGTPTASPWVVGFNEVARQAIFLDGDWQLLKNDPVHLRQASNRGLKLARMIAMISYRSEVSFQDRFGREQVAEVPEQPFSEEFCFQVESYLHYQGEKLVRRFDPFTYIVLTKAMDWHDISAGYGNLERALARIRARVACVGIDTDRLFTAREMRDAAEWLRKLGKPATYHEIRSPHGHDAFLIEFDQLNVLIRQILEDAS